MKKKYIYMLAIIVIAIIVILIVSIRSCSRDSPQDRPSETTSGKPLDFIPAADDEKITIPAVNGLVFTSGTLRQSIDLYNPNANCYFIVTILLSNDSEIYRSDYIAPGEHITDIELTQTLQRGIYQNCRMVYNCYSIESKSPLNNAEIKIEITSK